MRQARQGVAERLCNSPRRAALCLGLCAFALALPGLGNLDGLGHPDEQFYLSIAVDSYDHQRVVPTHDDDPVFPKPPLVFWLSHLSLLAFGRNAAAARLPGALAAGLTVAGTVLFTAEIATVAVAPLAGALVLGSLGVIRFGRELMLDLPLSACLAFALWAFAAAARGRAHAAIWAGALSALSLAIKGPIGVAVLAIAAGVGLWREGRLEVLGSRHFWLGVALGSCVSLPWYVWAAVTHWEKFYVFHIQEQYFSRFDSAHGQSRFNLLWGTLLYAAPFWPLSLHGLWRRPLGTRLAWLLGWLGGFYGLFLLPKEHGLHYPVLVLTPLAVLAAVAACPRWLRVSLGVVVGAAALGLGAVLAFPEVPRAAGAIAVALGVLAGIALGGRTRATLALGSLLLAGSASLALATVAPALGRPLVSAPGAALGQSTPIALLWEHPGPYRLEAGWSSQAQELWGDGPLRVALDAGRLVFARDHILARADQTQVARLVPVLRWRRTRPYLSLQDIVDAWRARDLDALGEWCGVYRAASP